ncbi:MAG: S41 family peptidase [Fretibacterium sp.]|nr:S41 family peptidase [Fretibacterium sp.]
MQKRNRWLVGGAVCAGLIGLIFIVGWLFQAVAGASELSDFERISPFSARSLWLLRQARAIVEAYQVDADSKPVQEDDLVRGAVKGMVDAWEDPYTRFVPPDRLKDEEIEMEGQYGGLGMYVGERDGRILVISPIEGTPADRAGLKPMDQIVKIEEEVVLGWDTQKVVTRLRGKPNTSVAVWIRREGEDELLKFDLTREIIKIVSVRHEILSDDIGYLRLTQFKQKTDEEARDAVKDMLKKGIKGLVLDLRNNGGGLLDVSVRVSSLFLKGGLVVGTKGRAERANEDYYADTAYYLTDVPMTVLINKGSASASEIVAGALVDRKRAVSVGEKSFGKGSVQTLFNLTDGSGLYVTIARYHTPSGKVIDHVGLTPNIEVKGDPQKDPAKDAPLQRAIAEVKKQIESSSNDKRKTEGKDRS